MLELSGLDRGDGKRQNGITIYPHSCGHYLIWDATSVNTLCILEAVHVTGSVDDAAEVKKTPNSLCWTTLHLPTSSVRDICHHGEIDNQSFLDLVCRLAARFHDQRENYYLFKDNLCLFLEVTPSVFSSYSVASTIEFINSDMCLCMYLTIWSYQSY